MFEAFKEHIKLPKEECFSVCEPIESEKIKAFFSFYPERVIFVENKNKEVRGIISFAEFRKGIVNGAYPINENFKRVILHKNYMAQLKEIFNTTAYKCIPVLDEKNRLVECFCRKERHYSVIAKDKWLDIQNAHLAMLIRQKKYKKICICITNPYSYQLYYYFWYYKDEFDTVRKIFWYDAANVKKDELLITNEYENATKIYLDIESTVCTLNLLQTELEFNLFLYHCTKNQARFFLVNLPTASNVWNVTKEEKQRICEGKSWQVYLKNKEQYPQILQEVLESNDGKDDFIESCLNLPTVIRKGQLQYHREKISKYVNIVNGIRVTTDLPRDIRNHVYLSGNSFVFGLMVSDENTIASILQRCLNNSSKYLGYAVVNQGVRGISLYESLKRLNHNNFNAEDIVVLFVNTDTINFLKNDNSKESFFCDIDIYHLEDAFNALDRTRVKSYFLESPIHPNRYGYQIAANYLMDIFQRDYKYQWNKVPVEDFGCVNEEKDYFLQENEALKRYLKELQRYYKEGYNGAIVMNCNPLTYGHRWLIEYAAAQVEHLYIFVVQEDKSEFAFEERIAMVEACTEGESNIIVLPSGQFIISSFTFPEYFTKESARPDTKIDASKDVDIFGKYIASELNIKMRFVGEEPLDFVTNQYNESMKRLLPSYGVQLLEIPRYEKKDIGVVSATKVRESIKTGDWQRVKELVPETTFRILERKYKKNEVD